MNCLGVDIGGSEIKAAVVDRESGSIRGEVVRIATPRPATIPAIADVVDEISNRFGWDGPIGCAFPGPIVDGLVRDPGFLDPSWHGVAVESALGAGRAESVVVLNDADAAGLAEMAFGAGAGHDGTVLVLTFGTGIGSALFRRGHLVPNTEFGTLPLGDVSAEQFASARVRTTQQLTFDEWAERASVYLEHISSLMYPDLIVLGGAISGAWDQFAQALRSEVDVVPAHLVGDAGIVGAALAARPARVELAALGESG